MQTPKPLTVPPEAQKHNAITHVTSLEHIDFARADKDTLVVFDVDYTLTRPDASTGMFGANRKKWGQIINEMKAQHPGFAADPDRYFSVIFMQQREIIMEPGVYKILDDLKRRGTRTIACTSWPAGRLGRIPDAAQHRLDVLQRLGISFAYSYPDVKSTLHVPSAPANKQPDLRKGIICTNGVDKGPALKAFIDRTGFKPKTVIFIDDAIKKVEDVGNMCAQEGIAFFGYHYEYPEQAKWNEELVRFKLTRLIHEEQWFASDEEAMKAYLQSEGK